MPDSKQCFKDEASETPVGLSGLHLSSLQHGGLCGARILLPTRGRPGSAHLPTAAGPLPPCDQNQVGAIISSFGAGRDVCLGASLVLFADSSCLGACLSSANSLRSGLGSFLSGCWLSVSSLSGTAARTEAGKKETNGSLSLPRLSDQMAGLHIQGKPLYF